MDNPPAFTGDLSLRYFLDSEADGRPDDSIATFARSPVRPTGDRGNIALGGSPILPIPEADTSMSLLMDTSLGSFLGGPAQGRSAKQAQAQGRHRATPSSPLKSALTNAGTSRRRQESLVSRGKGRFDLDGEAALDELDEQELERLAWASMEEHGGNSENQGHSRSRSDKLTGEERRLPSASPSSRRPRSRSPRKTELYRPGLENEPATLAESSKALEITTAEKAKGKPKEQRSARRVAFADLGNAMRDEDVFGEPKDQSAHGGRGLFSAMSPKTGGEKEDKTCDVEKPKEDEKARGAGHNDHRTRRRSVAPPAAPSDEPQAAEPGQAAKHAPSRLPRQSLKPSPRKARHNSDAQSCTEIQGSEYTHDSKVAPFDSSARRNASPGKLPRKSAVPRVDIGSNGTSVTGARAGSHHGSTEERRRRLGLPVASEAARRGVLTSASAREEASGSTTDRRGRASAAPLLRTATEAPQVESGQGIYAAKTGEPTVSTNNGISLTNMTQSAAIPSSDTVDGSEPPTRSTPQRSSTPVKVRTSSSTKQSRALSSRRSASPRKTGIPQDLVMHTKKTAEVANEAKEMKSALPNETVEKPASSKDAQMEDQNQRGAVGEGRGTEELEDANAPAANHCAGELGDDVSKTDSTNAELPPATSSDKPASCEDELGALHSLPRAAPCHSTAAAHKTTSSSTSPRVRSRARQSLGDALSSRCGATTGRKSMAPSFGRAPMPSRRESAMHIAVKSRALRGSRARTSLGATPPAELRTSINSHNPTTSAASTETATASHASQEDGAVAGFRPASSSSGGYLVPTTRPKGFSFATDARHAKHAAELAARARAEQEEKRKRATYRANPVPDFLKKRREQLEAEEKAAASAAAAAAADAASAGSGLADTRASRSGKNRESKMFAPRASAVPAIPAPVSKPFKSAVETRLEARHEWEAKRAAKEAALEAARARLRAEREAQEEREYLEARKRAVPRANPVPDFLKRENFKTEGKGKEKGKVTVTK